MTRKPCPTPYKIWFSSRREAIQSVVKGRGVSKTRAQLRPYHCTCGGWHLSHLSKRQAKENRKRRENGDEKPPER